MHAVALYRRLNEAGLRPGRDISILGLLPEARAQYLIPTLTTYQTNWTEIGKRLADAVTSEIIAAATDREPEEGTVPKLLHARVQYRMPVEFRPGESVHRVEASG
jgi:DNA-binding LacI/PurR family transcriptional regulator